MDILKQLRYFDHKSFHQIPDLGLTLFSDYVRCAKKEKCISRILGNIFRAIEDQ